jgi:hypothetical protein
VAFEYRHAAKKKQLPGMQERFATAVATTSVNQHI